MFKIETSLTLEVFYIITTDKTTMKLKLITSKKYYVSYEKSTDWIIAFLRFLESN